MSFLDQIRAKATLLILSRGTKIKSIAVGVIPKNWSYFSGTSDTWINVEFPKSENTSACIYKGQEGSIFPPHKHNKNVEHFTILNKSGRLEVVTENEIVNMKYPQAMAFDKGEVHAVRFITDTKILCMWHPQFNGNYDGEIIKQK